MKATLFFDGSSMPHTIGGTAGWGYVLEIEGKDPIEGSGRVKEGLSQTNNVGEYSGLIEGLRRAYSEGVSDLHVIGDSQLIIYQMTGKYKVKNPELKKLNEEAKQLVWLFENIVFEWQRRVHNKADALSRPKE